MVERRYPMHGHGFHPWLGVKIPHVMEQLSLCTALKSRCATMTTGKTTALTRQTFVGKVMSLLLNMLSRLVITFLPRSKRLLIHGCSHHMQWFWSPKNKVWHSFHCFPIYFPWSDGTRCHDLRFRNVEFLCFFCLFVCFHFIKISL